MADKPESSLAPPTPEQRRVAAGQYERANEVLATGNHDYAIQLLQTCCQLDPANLIYRKALRNTQKKKFKHNQRGSRFSLLTNSAAKLRLKSARRAGMHLKVLEHAEEILNRNPWDAGAQKAMAEAFVALGLIDQAAWTLEQVRRKDPDDLSVNRALARLYEHRGEFNLAMALWELVRRADPNDKEAYDKGKDLAARETIARGGYERKLGGEEQDGAEDETATRADARTAEPTLVGGVPLPPVSARIARDAAPLLARLKTDPTDPGPYGDLAALFRRAGQLEQAREVLQRGLERAGNHFGLAAELADVETEPFRRNLALAEQRLREQPEDEALRKVRVRLLKEINTRELDLFRQKADRYPTDLSYRLELGLRLLRAGQLDEAISELQAARADPACHWRALVYLGFCFKTRNNWRLAQRNFEEALRKMPADEDGMRKEVLYQLAQGAADAGDLPKALEAAYELADLDFGYKNIGKRLDEWQAKVPDNGAEAADEQPPPAE